jgi:hypothetical protein
LTQFNSIYTQQRSKLALPALFVQKYKIFDIFFNKLIMPDMMY